MEEDTIIQKDLFVINHELKRPNNSNQIPEDLSTEELKKESQKRPRQRKSSSNLVNKFKNDSNTERKNDCINEKSYSCLLYTSPSPRDRTRSRMPSSA